jgi:hypothetical protein
MLRMMALFTAVRGIDARDAITTRSFEEHDPKVVSKKESH